MSQFFTSSSGSTPPPIVVETLTGDTGVATASGNNINVPGATSTVNNNNGITTTGSGATLTVALTNRLTATLTTTNTTTQNLISFSLGATPAAYAINGSVIGYVPATGDSGGYFFEGTFTTNGTTAAIIGGQFSSFQESSGFSAANVFVTTSGNNFLCQVTGIAATTIHWNALFNYLEVT